MKKNTGIFSLINAEKKYFARKDREFKEGFIADISAIKRNCLKFFLLFFCIDVLLWLPEFWDFKLMCLFFLFSLCTFVCMLFWLTFLFLELKMQKELAMEN